MTTPNLNEQMTNSPKTVWMINHYAAYPSKDGWAGRHQKLSENLRDNGWRSVLITSSTGHPIGTQHLKGWRLRRLGEDAGVAHLMLKSTPYAGNGIPRFINMIVFAALCVVPGSLRGLPRPDVIIGSTVHPLAGWAGMLLARRYRVPFIFEIRDVWPDALIHLGQLSANGSTARAVRKLMLSVARRADLVLAPLPGIDRYLKEHGITDTPFLWVSNGIDSEQDLPNDSHTRAATSPFTFMYLGSHGNANALDRVLDAFDVLVRSEPDLNLELRLVGDGPRKKDLVEYASSLASANRITFEPRIPREEVLSRAREADILLAYLHDHPVYQYGISPNKLFDYLLSARPVVFATTALNNPIADANAGIAVPHDDAARYAEAMHRAMTTDAMQRQAWGENGREYALTNFSYSSLAQRLAEGLDQLVASRGESGRSSK